MKNALLISILLLGINSLAYAGDNCGMGVNATCAKCDEPLKDDSLKLDDGSSVQISKCPNGHGKIKSPMCCGSDMRCAI